MVQTQSFERGDMGYARHGEIRRQIYSLLGVAAAFPAAIPGPEQNFGAPRQHLRVCGSRSRIRSQIFSALP